MSEVIAKNIRVIEALESAGFIIPPMSRRLVITLDIDEAPRIESDGYLCERVEDDSQAGNDRSSANYKKD